MATTNEPGIAGKYPTTIQQRAFIALLTSDAESEIPAIVKLAFLVSPSIDVRRLERTFAKLASRHDSLRQSLERRGDDWFVNVWNRHRTGVIVEDHGDIGDSEFEALLEHHSSAQIALLDDILFQAIVLRCGQRGDVLFIRCHHAIVDGYSMVILIEDWLRLLIGIPLVGKGLTHEEFLSEYFGMSSTQKFDNKKYWESLLLPALPNPGLGTFGRVGERPSLVHQKEATRVIAYSLTQAEFNEIPIALGAGSQTSFSIVQAAFASTILELSGLPGIYVQTTFGRTSSKLRNFVGYPLFFPTIRCDATNGLSLAEYSAALASQRKQSLIHTPSEALIHGSDLELVIKKSGGVLRHFNCTLDEFSGPRVKQSPFSTGFAVPPGTSKKIGPLTITRLKITPSSYNFYGLRLRIVPSGDQTIFNFIYDSGFYTDKDIETLLLGMQEKLNTSFS